MTQWRYTGNCKDARLQALLVIRPFNDIADWVKHEMQILCCHPEDCNDKHRYKRASYCVEVSPQLFDVFFNSQSGYRGAYFQSPEEGLAANRLLLSAVSPVLVAWTRKYCTDPEPNFAAKSLAGASAKAWLAEGPLRRCEGCEGEWNSSMPAHLQIINGRWELDSHIHAEWGRRAPWFRKIRFFGAFLNEMGDEYVAPRKSSRAKELWARGWS